jgi:hypothetical protein
MKSSAFSLLAMAALAAGCASTPPADSTSVPADVLAMPTCQQDVILKPRVTRDPDLVAAFEAFGGNRATVITSYHLDGSGKAVGPEVVYANPERLFDKIALRQLGETRFAPGTVRKSCADVRTYTVKSVDTVLPIR